MIPPLDFFNRQKENNAIVNNVVDEIILQENNKVSAEAEAHEKNEYYIDDNDLYHVDNMSLDDNRENTERRKHVFESKLENKYDIEIQIGMTCIHGNKVNKLVE